MWKCLLGVCEKGGVKGIADEKVRSNSLVFFYLDENVSHESYLVLGHQGQASLRPSKTLLLVF